MLFYEPVIETEMAGPDVEMMFLNTPICCFIFNRYGKSRIDFSKATEFMKFPLDEFLYVFSANCVSYAREKSLKFTCRSLEMK